MPNDDQEPGWGALSVFLRPVRAIVAAKQWWHDLWHPEPPDRHGPGRVEGP